MLGHVLTPSNTKVIEQPPAAAAGGGDRVIIINNGQPINATDGVTVINNGQQQPAEDAAKMGMPVPLAPIVNNTEPANNPPVQPIPPAGVASGEQSAPPPPGGIICVPVFANETDPNDSSKMIQVEKIACYNAPPLPPANGTMEHAQQQPNNESAPLAPMSNNNLALQQMQSTESKNMADENVKSASSKASLGIFHIRYSVACGLLLSYALTLKFI